MRGSNLAVAHLRVEIDDLWQYSQHMSAIERDILGLLDVTMKSSQWRYMRADRRGVLGTLLMRLMSPETVEPYDHADLLTLVRATGVDLSAPCQPPVMLTTRAEWFPGGTFNNQPEFINGDYYYFAIAEPYHVDGPKWLVVTVRAETDGEGLSFSHADSGDPFDDWLDVDWYMPASELTLPFLQAPAGSEVTDG